MAGAPADSPSASSAPPRPPRQVVGPAHQFGRTAPQPRTRDLAPRQPRRGPPECVLNLLARQRGELVTGRRRTVPTFAEAVEKVIAVHRARWKGGGRQEKLWRSTLRDYAMPRLGGLPVNRIHTADVMAVLQPIWNEKRVTAQRVRRRISAVMRRAVAQGYREDNPAGEAIGAALPRNGVRPRHHPALPYAEVAGAIQTVRTSGACPATVLAFEFLVLTACRGGEVRGALWERWTWRVGNGAFRRTG